MGRRSKMKLSGIVKDRMMQMNFVVKAYWANIFRNMLDFCHEDSYG